MTSTTTTETATLLLKGGMTELNLNMGGTMIDTMTTVTEIATFGINTPPKQTAVMIVPGLTVRGITEVAPMSRVTARVATTVMEKVLRQVAVTIMSKVMNLVVVTIEIKTTLKKILVISSHQVKGILTKLGMTRTKVSLATTGKIFLKVAQLMIYGETPDTGRQCQPTETMWVRLVTED